MKNGSIYQHIRESDNTAKNNASVVHTNIHIPSQNTSNALKNSTQTEESILPWNVFIHDSVKAVVQITAWQSKVNQRSEEMYPTKARTVFNIAWFTVKSNNRLNVQKQYWLLVFWHWQAVWNKHRNTNHVNGFSKTVNTFSS